MLLRSLVALAVLSLWSSAFAETAYVTDVLRLGLHREQDTSDPAFRNLLSGTQLEVLQRVPNYAEVETVDGDRGWVRSAFLMPDKPAQLIVDEAVAALEAARRDLATAVAARDLAEQEVERLLAGEAAQDGFVRDTEADFRRLRAENAEYAALLEAYRGSVPVVWVGGAVGLALLIGFLSGIWCLDQYVRRRHSGFRPY